MEPAIYILIVDDEARNLDALEVILANSPYELLRATDPDGALRALLQHDVAAIVMDIHMPDLSGVELAKLIKGTKKFREIPIVFLTAHLMEDQDVIAGYGAGAVDYLTKPVNPEIFRRKIAVFADLFRKTRALAEVNLTLEELNQTLETRVQQRTAELERSEAALRLAAQQKDEFLATLAHELRNPLAPLRMGLDLLLHSGAKDPIRTLSVMNRQLDHMVRLIDDLLDIARVSGGKLELKKEHANLSEAVRTAVDTCRPFLEKRRQSLDTSLDSSIYAFADPTRLAQVIGNLLHNASKFSADQAQIRIELMYDDGHAFIRVIDSGIGIAPEHVSRVFDMFTRVDSAGTQSNMGGLGIGLALARRLVEMHDGALTVESTGLGKGSVFTFSLPASRGDEASPGSVAPTAISASTSAVNVVVIEDNQDSAEMLQLSLQTRGFVASIAHTGLAGVALVKERQPRIVLCDIGLPEMDGIEVCRQVRALDLGYRPVMVALTGWGTTEDVQRTRASGFDHHLVKPVAPELLFELLERLASPIVG